MRRKKPAACSSFQELWNKIRSTNLEIRMEATRKHRLSANRRFVLPFAGSSFEIVSNLLRRSRGLGFDIRIAEFPVFP
jgi:hypothetical protein